MSVFGFFDTAGAVNKASARAHEAGSGVEQLKLKLCAAFDVFRLEAPFDICPALNHAGVRAGRVEHDGVVGRGQVAHAESVGAELQQVGFDDPADQVWGLQ